MPALSGLLDQLLGGLRHPEVGGHVVGRAHPSRRPPRTWTGPCRGSSRRRERSRSPFASWNEPFLASAVAADTLMLHAVPSPARRGRRWWRMAAAATAMIALVAALGGRHLDDRDRRSAGTGTAARSDRPDGGTDTGVVSDGMPVPDVASLSVTDARDTLLDAGFTLAAAEPTAGPPGTVVGSPASGGDGRRGRRADHPAGRCGARPSRERRPLARADGLRRTIRRGGRVWAMP